MLMRVVAAVSLAVLVLACDERKETREVSEPAAPPPTPPVVIDGSSTVFPITRAVVKLWAENVTAELKLGALGTSAGLKKLCQKEASIAGASRPIRESESKLCLTSNVDFIELPVAFDGIAVVVNPRNDWARAITVAELKTLWEPAAEGQIKKWSDVRPGWPKEPIKLYGPGRDSGTFDYFTEAIVGQARSSRQDYTGSEDDDVLVNGVANDQYALGYFGFSYYIKNAQRLRAIGIDDGIADNGKGPIAPSPATIVDASYQPLSRPLFIYASVEAAKRKEVSDFIKFYLRAARMVASDVGCIPLPEAVYDLARQRFVGQHVGSAFEGARTTIGITIEDVLRAEGAEMVHVAGPDSAR